MKQFRHQEVNDHVNTLFADALHITTIIPYITVAPVILSVVRSSPSNATVSLSFSDMPESLEISVYIANGSTTIEQVC